MRLKELSVELRDRIVKRHRSGEGYQKMSAALKVPRNTVASIILKWKKFGTTSPQLEASLNSTPKTPVSTLTVKRRLRDAGLLGRVAKKKPYLRLANKNKRLRWAKGHRHEKASIQESPLHC
jgi:hypothetical protein